MKNKYDFIKRLKGCRENGILPVIAEIKASTPQCPDLLRQRSVSYIANQYEKSDVACISVVTGRWFGGTTSLLEEAASTTSLPILRKDFIVSCSGIDYSRKIGASAILLTKKLIELKTLDILVNYALEIGITPFVEVDSINDLGELKLNDRTVLAICNRDIRTKETDDGNISKSLTLLNKAQIAGAGAVVSASAIRTPDEASQLINAGYDGLLIGTAFLQASDLNARLMQFSNALRTC